MAKISFSYFELCFKVTYSRLPITPTLANSNKNQFPLDFFQTFTFTLTRLLEPPANSKLFLFSFSSFVYNFTLDNPKCSAVSVEIYFNTTVYSLSVLLCQSTSNTISSPDHEYSSSFVASIPFSKYQFIPRCPWSKVCMIPGFLPTHLLTSFFSVISFELPIIWTFFDFPRRFELSRVDCILLGDNGKGWNIIF